MLSLQIQSVTTVSLKLRKGNAGKAIVTQRGFIVCHRESHLSAEALLTVELTLAAPLKREMAAVFAAKRNTGMRAKGILTTEC